MRRPIASGTVETEFRVMFAPNPDQQPVPVDSQRFNTRDEAEDRILEGIGAGWESMSYSVQRRIIVRTETAWEEVE